MKKNIAILGIIIGVLLILNGINMSIPESNAYGAQEYVGGDAYNYMIEASLRGGQIAGATISKSIYIVGGVIVSTIFAFKYIDEKEKNSEINKHDMDMI